MRTKISWKTIVMLFLTTIFLNGCASLLTISKKPRLAKDIGETKIEVFVISAHRHIDRQFQELNSFGHGTDTRIVSKMMTSTDKFLVYSSCLFIFPLFLFPSASDIPSAVDGDLLFEKFQKFLGPSINLINRTKEYPSEKHFLQAKRKTGGLYMVYHTCDLDNYPVRYDISRSSSYVQYFLYKVNAVAVRLLLFENDRKILDYRETTIADMIGNINPTAFFETQEILHDRSVVKIRDKIQEVLSTP
jgi:hypothetical protein